MVFKRYYIPDSYWYTFKSAPKVEWHTKQYQLVDLLRESKFYIMPSKYMGGITFHKNAILLHKEFNSWSSYNQLRIIGHEGFHVGQQRADGWFKFMWNYTGEWIKSGFSYEKMKSFGIERAAYDYEKWFATHTTKTE